MEQNDKKKEEKKPKVDKKTLEIIKNKKAEQLATNQIVRKDKPV